MGVGGGVVESSDILERISEENSAQLEVAADQSVCVQMPDGAYELDENIADTALGEASSART